jgi:hypothetical protein
MYKRIMTIKIETPDPTLFTYKGASIDVLGHFSCVTLSYSDFSTDSYLVSNRSEEFYDAQNVQISIQLQDMHVGAKSTRLPDGRKCISFVELDQRSGLPLRRQPFVFSKPDALLGSGPALLVD